MIELPANAELRLEILCSIPTGAGTFVRAKDLMADYKFDKYRDLLKVIEGTKEIEVFNGPKGEGRCLRIAPGYWRSANERTEKYWQRMYETPSEKRERLRLAFSIRSDALI